MDVQQFAETHNLKISRDACNAKIVQGKYSHIFDGYADGRFGLLFTAPTKRRWNAVRKQLQSAGFIVKQNGDTEGVLAFDPGDKAQVRLALQASGVKPRRAAAPPSAAQLAARQAFAVRRRSQAA